MSEISNNRSEIINQLKVVLTPEEFKKINFGEISNAELQTKLNEALTKNKNWGSFDSYSSTTDGEKEQEITQGEVIETKTTSENGDEITEKKQNDTILEKIIKHTDSDGKVVETVITFKNGKPEKRTRKENGRVTETTKFSTKKDKNGNEYVVGTTMKPNLTVVEETYKKISDDGFFDDNDFVQRETRSQLNGASTIITREKGIIKEQKLDYKGEGSLRIYDSASISDYDSGKLQPEKEYKVSNRKVVSFLVDKKYASVNELEMSFPNQFAKSNLTDKNQHELFDMFDINGNPDGILDSSELQYLLKFISNNADIFKDGTITEAELQALSKALQKNGIKNADFKGFIDAIRAHAKSVQSHTGYRLDNGDIREVIQEDSGRTSINLRYPDGDMKKRGYMELPWQESEISGWKTYTDGFHAYSLEEDVLGNLVHPLVKETYSPRYQRELETFALTHFEKVNQEIHDIYSQSRQAINPFTLAGDLLSTAGTMILTGSEGLSAANEDNKAMYNIIKASHAVHQSGNQTYLSDGSERIEDFDNAIDFEKFNEAYKTNFKKDFDYRKAEIFMSTAKKYEQVTALKTEIDALERSIKLAKSAYKSKETSILTEAEVEELKSYGINVNYDKKNVGLDKYENRMNLYLLSLCRTVGHNSNVMHELMEMKDILPQLNDSDWAKILEKTQDGLKQAYKDALGSKSYNDLEGDYRQQYSEIYGTSFNNKAIMENMITAGNMIGQVAEMAVVMGVTQGLAGVITSEMASGFEAYETGKNVSGLADMFKGVSARFGQEGTAQLTRFMGNMAFPVSDIAIKTLTAGGKEERMMTLEHSADTAFFALFGGYLASPFAKTVGEVIEAKTASKLLSQVMELGSETTAFAMFDAMSQNEELQNVFLSNGQTMLSCRLISTVLGSRTNKMVQNQIKKAMQDIKIEKTVENGKDMYSIKQNGSVVFQTDNPQQIIAGLLAMGTESGLKAELQSNLESVQKERKAEFKDAQKITFTSDDLPELKGLYSRIEIENGMVCKIEDNGKRVPLGKFESTIAGEKAGVNDGVEWRKMNIGGEEVEVAVTKNADGSENIDISKARKLNANGEYENFALTTERDLLSSEGEVDTDGRVHRSDAPQEGAVRNAGTGHASDGAKTTSRQLMSESDFRAYLEKQTDIDYTNAKNLPKPRFTSEELDKIMEFYKKVPDFVDALINHKISLAHRLIPKVKNDPKAMSFVTKNITKLSKVNVDAFNSNEITNILDLYTKYGEPVRKIVEAHLEDISYEDIKDIMNKPQQYIDFILTSIESKYKDSDGNLQPKFENLGSIETAWLMIGENVSYLMQEIIPDERFTPDMVMSFSQNCKFVPPKFLPLCKSIALSGNDLKEVNLHTVYDLYDTLPEEQQVILDKLIEKPKFLGSRWGKIQDFEKGGKNVLEAAFSSMAKDNFAHSIEHYIDEIFKPYENTNKPIEKHEHLEESDPFYQEMFDYYSNLKTKSGKSVFGTENSDEIKECSKYMASLPDVSNAATSMRMLTELVTQEQVGAHVLHYLPKEGEINPLISQEVQRFYEAYINNIPFNDVICPTFKSKNPTEVEIGEVFEVEGEKNIYIKTQDGTTTQLKMDKETYCKLFPPIERYATTQNDIGNCWQLTGFNGLLRDNIERQTVLECFSQDGNDIVINFPNGKLKDIRFKNGQLPEGANPLFYSEGALGVNLLEFAQAREIAKTKVDKYLQQYRDKVENAETPEAKKEAQEKLEFLTSAVEDNFDNTLVYGSEGDMKISSVKSSFDFAINEYRDGGSTDTVLDLLGYEDAQRIDISNNRNKYYHIDFLSNPETYRDYLVGLGSKHDESRIFEQPLEPDRGLVTGHAYWLRPEFDENGPVIKFNTINPWGIVEGSFNAEEIFENHDSIYIAKRRSTGKNNDTKALRQEGTRNDALANNNNSRLGIPAQQREGQAVSDGGVNEGVTVESFGEIGSDGVRRFNQSDIQQMKSEGLNISVMPDGTVIKTDPSGKTEAVGKWEKTSGNRNNQVPSDSNNNPSNTASDNATMQILKNSGLTKSAIEKLNSFGISEKLSAEQLLTQAKDISVQTGVDREGKPIFELTKEGEELVWQAARQIRKIALEQEPSIIELMRQLGLTSDESIFTDKNGNTIDMAHRAKSDQSLHDKIRTEIVKSAKKGKELSFAQALLRVSDAVGCRTANLMKEYANEKDVKAALDNGDKKTAIQLAIQHESAKVFEALRKYIDSVAEGTNKVEITRIANYIGEDGIPYFTEKQLLELKMYANSKGVNLPIVERVLVSSERDGAKVKNTYNNDATTQVRGSGYTALQMNFRVKETGFVYEWQYRGQKVNEFAEGEHVPYDLRTGKDIIGENKELSELYEPMKKLLDKENMSPDDYAEYENYLTQHYEYLRLQELGFNDGKNPPELPAKFDIRLSAKNLILLHKYSEKIKSEPEKAKEYVKEYEENLNV